jgi:hypothetical protein
LDFGTDTAKLRLVAVATGNQWTKNVIMVTRLLRRSRRKSKLKDKK